MISSSRSCLISWFSTMHCAQTSITNCSVVIKIKFWSMLRAMAVKKLHLLNKLSKARRVNQKKLMKISKMQISKKHLKRILPNFTDCLMSSERLKTTLKSFPETVTGWALNTNSTLTVNSMDWTSKQLIHRPTGFISVHHKHHKPESNWKKTLLFSIQTSWTT